MGEKVKEIKKSPTLIEIIYNDRLDLKKLSSREEFRIFIREDSLKTIEGAITRGLKKVELFNIFNLSLIVELDRSNFKSVLENIINYYIEDEDYEMCNHIKHLIDEI